MKLTDQVFPGALGGIAALHGIHYARDWGFGSYFEAKVAGEIAAFALRQSPTDLVLLARDDQGLAASLVLDLNDPVSGQRGAHLRWFIVADRCRGGRLGRQMLARAMAHVDSHAGGRAWLTTFAGLHAARHLYETSGFRLVAEAEGEAWGTPVREQEFRRG